MDKIAEIGNCERSKSISDGESEEQGEEESLSLRDLPVSAIHEDKQSTLIKSDEVVAEEDFDFGSLAGSIDAEGSKMCAADEVFYRGQILPLRHSISSDTGLARSRSDSRSISRSESMEHGSACGFRSASTTSSRSSSTKSHYSVTSSTSSSSSNAAQKPKFRNHFHSYPSPKPHIRAAGAQSLPNSTPRRKSYSSIWEFVRLGLVRTPEIELHDLKARHASLSNNSVIGRSSSNSNGNCRAKSTENLKTHGNIFARTKTDLNLLKERRHGKNGSILNGCKLSVWVAEPIPRRVVVLNDAECSSSSRAEGAARGNVDTERIKKQQQHRPQQGQGKQTASRHRTFEWLKDLSHSGVLNPI
ncbi:hypothetical protein Nepgr_008217 [Nepenthes gracilis]|uniref:FHA domain-containing protein n=1 Tax=Nepenthes gracilis TaxID=150966 RepID=A0AAD3S948_NEPGR|nr:hypothetical protein Nepgr_008217 [Nepenthes gracilis]